MASPSRQLGMLATWSPTLRQKERAIFLHTGFTGSLYSRGILTHLRSAHQEHCVSNKPFNKAYMYVYIYFVLLVFSGHLLVLGLARQMDMRTNLYSGNIERAKEVIALVEHTIKILATMPCHYTMTVRRCDGVGVLLCPFLRSSVFVKPAQHGSRRRESTVQSCQGATRRGRQPGEFPERF